MRLKNKLFLLTVLPLLAVITAVGLIVFIQAERLAAQQAAAIEESQLAAGQKELHHYVHLASTAIRYLNTLDLPEETLKQRARAILKSMNYGDDGYFFVYAPDGTNLVHPRQQELEGRNLWNMRDPQGVPVIQELTAAARAGGGYVRYQWRKPSTSQGTDKLGYATLVEPWGWMMGTGIYLDDMERTMQRVRQETSANIRATMGWLALVAVLAVLLVFAAGLALNISENRLADKKLRTLAQRIVSAQEEERARLSRELHDGISQDLVSIKYQFELAQHKLDTGSAAPEQELRQGIGRLSAAIAEIRRISHDLRPTLLDDLGLPSALVQLATDFSRHTGIQVLADVQIGAEPLPADAALALFRVAQEGLTNIQRHSQASEAWIHLSREAGQLILCLSDNGQGFREEDTARDPKRGIGLRNMRERLEYLGGSLTVESSPGETRLTATLPLNRQPGALPS